VNEYSAPVPTGPASLPVLDSRVLSTSLAGASLTDTIQQESPLRKYWRIFFKRRYTILAVTAACVALALLMAMLTQKEYTSTVTLQVDREAPKVVSVGGVEAEGGNSYSQEFYQTQYSLLKSRSLSEAVVRDLRLTDDYDFLSGYSHGKVDDLKQLPRARRFQIATSIVNGGTLIAPIRMSSIIEVRYVSPSSAMAARVANSIGEKFIEENLNRRFEATAYARQFLENRLNAVRGKLEDSERKAAEYARAQGLIKISGAGVSATGGSDGSISSEQTLTSQDLSQLSSQLASARTARIQAEADMRGGGAGKAAEASLTNGALNALRQQRSELTGQLSKLQSDFGPDYPSVIALKSQIGELDRQIGREQSRVTSSVASDVGGKYRAATQAENGLQAKVNSLKSAVLDQQQRTIQYNIIQRDVDTNRALYDSLLQRFKEVGVAGGVGTNNVSIVDRALVPGLPSKPNLRLNLIVGLLFGLMLGCGVALLLEQLAEATVSSADFQRKLGVPLLGATPKLDQSSIDEALAKSNSPLSEAYFSILTSIQFSTSHGTPKSLLLTSTQPREGKSTTALALALGLASVGARVLLIDGDMRNPSLHRLLDKPLGGGLSSLLTGDGKIEDFIEPSGTNNLSFLPAGRIPPNPAELLSSDLVQRIVEAAVAMFDHVVIDGPPVLGLADAPLLSRSVESTVFVVESTRTRATQARQAIERILAVRGHFIGAVLTKFDEKSMGYGYGYGYDYRYGQ
jgi:succinoglycan biosynthesis transport protein ExoP